MTQQPLSIHQFGPYRIDAVNRLLLRNGAVVPLTPKCFEILLVLIENSGEVVTKQRLMNRVWLNSFVEEGNLTYNTSMLRKALGERANEHLYIVTAPGRGYQFVAGVSDVCLYGTEEAARVPSKSGGALNKQQLAQEQNDTEVESRKAVALDPLSRLDASRWVTEVTKR